MSDIIERIEQAGYHAGRTAASTTTTIYRNSRWTQEQADAYRKQFREGMAYSVLRGECRINPDGWIKSREEALDILGLAVAEEYLSEPIKKG